MSDMFLPLKRYFQFSGRSRRREYWLFLLLVILGSFFFGVLDALLGLGGDVTTSTGTGDDFSASAEATGGVLATIWTLATLVPSLSVAVRRLHDTDRRGWWMLIVAIPLVGAIVLIVLLCLRGTPGTNRFGPNPKGFSDEEAQEVFS